MNNSPGSRFPWAVDAGPQNFTHAVSVQHDDRPDSDRNPDHNTRACREEGQHCRQRRGLRIPAVPELQAAAKHRHVHQTCHPNKTANGAERGISIGGSLSTFLLRWRGRSVNDGIPDDEDDVHRDARHGRYGHREANRFRRPSQILTRACGEGCVSRRCVFKQVGESILAVWNRRWRLFERCRSQRPGDLGDSLNIPDEIEKGERAAHDRNARNRR